LGLAFVVLLAAVVRAEAQDAPVPQETGGPQVVVIAEKSPVAAGVLEWTLPTLGYGYAGDWTRGVPSALVRIAGVALFLPHLGSAFLFVEPPSCESKCVAGAVMLVGGTIWAIVDAGRTASRENARRRDAVLGSTVMPILGPTGRGIGVRISVGI